MTPLCLDATSLPQSSLLPLPSPQQAVPDHEFRARPASETLDNAALGLGARHDGGVAVARVRRA